MQQIGAREIVAAAQVVDPRKLPVMLSATSKRALVAASHTWVLHRSRVVRGAMLAFAVVALGVAYETREAIAAGFTNLSVALEGRFAEAGFGISQIEITGQVLTAESEIVKALAIQPQIATFNYDAEAARARLEDLPAVATASIRKIYPGFVQVSIAEKEAVARWRVDGVTFLVDAAGEQIAGDDGSFASLPLIVGDGANDDAMAMIRAMENYDGLRTGLAALSRIGDRRWDLIYYSGLRVQLPELGVGQALGHLETYQDRYKLLDRDVAVVDLRVPGIVSVKPVVREEPEPKRR